MGRLCDAYAAMSAVTESNSPIKSQVRVVVSSGDSWCESRFHLCPNCVET